MVCEFDHSDTAHFRLQVRPIRINDVVGSKRVGVLVDVRKGTFVQATIKKGPQKNTQSGYDSKLIFLHASTNVNMPLLTRICSCGRQRQNKFR
jgi:hypothetical protein